jgi:hypothetical protein
MTVEPVAGKRERRRSKIAAKLENRGGPGKALDESIDCREANKRRIWAIRVKFLKGVFKKPVTFLTRALPFSVPSSGRFQRPDDILTSS